MEVLTTTPFGQRPVTAALIERAQAAQEKPDIAHINKWELFRELCAAKAAFDVSDRDLTVLNALLSFHQPANLSDNDALIVFPSNMALAERAHGMAESTLRRHLAALVNAGLVARHDSPNGKRYAVRGPGGEFTRIFGFDLRPLLVRAKDITLAAAEARAATERMRRLREEITLLKRDAVKLLAYGQEEAPEKPWEAPQSALLDIHKAMRRKLPFDALKALRRDLGIILKDIHNLLADDAIETEKMVGTDADFERHYQNSNKDSYDSELRHENGAGGGDGPVDNMSLPAETVPDIEPRLPLALVLKSCPDLLPYVGDDIRHWHELVSAAGFVRGMMGISSDAWSEAQRAMGPANAAITVACILQRVSQINSPGGYLRSLSRKAQDGGFSPGPMVIAVLNGGDGQKS